MKLYHEFDLDCYKSIQDYVLSYMTQFNVDPIYVKNILLPQSLIEELNEELGLLGLPSASNFLCFKRRNCIINTDQVHIDTTRSLAPIESSIILPIEGCANTYMYWVNGDYKVIEKWIKNTDTPYADIEWQSIPKIAAMVNILDRPTLVRVDIPHSATSYQHHYRTILSIRLQGNPGFLDVLDRLS